MYQVHMQLTNGQTTTLVNPLEKSEAEATAERMLTLFGGKVVRTWVEPIDA